LRLFAETGRRAQDVVGPEGFVEKDTKTHSRITGRARVRAHVEGCVWPVGQMLTQGVDVL
jgi:hypothetical protein